MSALSVILSPINSQGIPIRALLVVNATGRYQVDAERAQQMYHSRTSWTSFGPMVEWKSPTFGFLKARL
ncbi:hypothetical protein CaCOL14_010149 [Colletotrichum acutatum]